MSVELLKVLVQPVVLERDADGAILGERVGEVTPLYSAEQLAEFVEHLHVEILNVNNRNGGGVMSETETPQGDPIGEPGTEGPAGEPDEDETVVEPTEEDEDDE